MPDIFREGILDVDICLRKEIVSYKHLELITLGYTA